MITREQFINDFRNLISKYVSQSVHNPEARLTWHETAASELWDEYIRPLDNEVDRLQKELELAEDDAAYWEDRFLESYEDITEGQPR